MKQINKTLGICLLVTALVYGVLKILGGAGFGDRAKGDTKVSSRDSTTRHERGEKASDASTRKFRQRARKLTSDEAKELLKTTIIPEIDFENIKLEDALKIVNEEIAKQTPDDQARPRILLHPYFNRPADDILEARSLRIDELRLRNAPASVLLKYICDKTKITYWFYKGDFYVSPIYDDGGASSFYLGERFSRIKLENIDASQLAGKLNEIIEEHDYFGPKRGINISTTEKAREALLKGEVQLPRINLDINNVTLMEVTMKIAEHTNGVLTPNYEGLAFNPFNEVNNTDPFAPAGEGGSFDIPLNEDTMNPNFVPVKDPFE